MTSDEPVNKQLDTIAENLLTYGFDVGKACRVISMNDLPESISYEEKFKMATAPHLARFKQSILDLIASEKVKELNEIAKHNYCEELGTYDFDGIAEEVLRRIK